MVPVSVADDQIYERYQAKAISEINRLGHEVTEALADRHPNAAPVMGTGHPLADIMSSNPPAAGGSARGRRVF